MSKFRHHSSGLILIEVAIAMIIFSLCIGAVLVVMQQSQNVQKSSTTQKHQLMITQALNRHHRQEGHIPCPSLPKIDDGFALEKCQGTYQQIGIVPYKTLGLPAYVVKDGYGHYFTYAVSEQSTIPKIDKDIPATANTLQIIDASGRQYGSKNHEIAYVLISHGLRGKGAFTLQSSRKRFPTTTEFETENAKDSLTFYADISSKDSDNTLFFTSRSDLDIPRGSAVSKDVLQENNRLVSEDDPYGLETTNN